MQTYYGTKRLKATPMTRLEYNNLRGWQLPADEDGADAGYLVEYADGGTPNVPGYAGYVSWSPKDVFEASYRPIDQLLFGHALEVLRAGGSVARAGWNGKGLAVKFQPAFIDPDSLKANLGFLYLEYPRNEEGSGNPIYPEGCRVPWIASQTDMLADDWMVLKFDNSL